MHIKQITISNFRSFRNQPEIYPFSQGTNAVVGRNGSGKSNLFDAVQFVLLSPKFWTLRTEDRQALLHEGSGTAAVNAYVEIIFDNRDGRFQGFSSDSSDEIVLRRTVGSKKDEIFLQRRKTSKNEVMSLLEGAGFSKSNPYFIVQQGKVNALCTMSDLERLELLKEVAGTTVYDEKKKESEGKMEENKATMEKIQETLTFMDERLEELRSETEELTQYQALDKERKALAYTLYDKELRKARLTLDDIEQDKVEEAEKRDAIYERARDTANKLATVEATLKTKSSILRRNTLQIQALEEDKRAATMAKTKLELQCQEAEESIKITEASLVRNKRELQDLNEEIDNATRELQTKAQPAFDEAREALTKMTTERNEIQKKIEALYAKQGRGKQFTSKKDRDNYLKQQISELNSAKEEKESFISEQREQLANLRRLQITTEDEFKRNVSEYSKKEKTFSALNQAIIEKKRERNEMAEKRKAQWGELSKLQERVSDAREDARRAFSNVRKVMPRNTANGLNALDRIIKEEGIVVGKQYFGPVMENIELVDAKFQTAVEVAAQNSLFHVIVDTDATAARLMKRLEEERLGRITFLPLNQLHMSPVDYPSSNDVVPLMEKTIRYDERLRKAMEQVFGKKLLARSVEVASTWSSKCNMDVVTLDGDLCSRKGALSGGFVDHSKSRLKAHSELKLAEETLRKLEASEREMKQTNTDIDREVTAIIQEVQRLEANHANLDHALNRIDDDINIQKNRLQNMQKQIEKIETEVVPPLELDITSIQSQIATLEDEIGAELSEVLTDDEKANLKTLKSAHTAYEIDIEKQTQIMEEASIERQRLKSLLDDNLLKRKHELEQDGDDESSHRRSFRDGQKQSRQAQSKRREELELQQRELESANHNVEDIQQRYDQAKSEDQEIRAELHEAKKLLENLRALDAKIAQEIEEAQKREERLMNKRALSVNQRELHARRIQELGSLPNSEELKKHKTESIQSLMRELEKVNKKLKGYSHVNKKALDQFVNLDEQRESLLKRKDEVDKGAEKVKELIESLDHKKDEAINRTFRGVSAHFRDVFKELVPNGEGELIMKTSLDKSDDSDDEDLTAEEVARKNQNPNVNKYQGIGIKVRFSDVGENYMMSQLSGGQKSLVALALIFAIQRCDPAPFYLFDELDQALDSSYRKAVAGLIQRQSTNKDTPTQFICSTFRPEIVAIADHCYGISHQDKVSNIYHLSKRDALSFIANLMSEEEAVGEVSTLASSKVSKTSNMTAMNKKHKAIKNVENENFEEVDSGLAGDDGSITVEN